MKKTKNKNWYRSDLIVSIYCFVLVSALASVVVFTVLTSFVDGNGVEYMLSMLFGGAVALLISALVNRYRG
jgi:putative flippase GtrA